MRRILSSTILHIFKKKRYDGIESGQKRDLLVCIAAAAFLSVCVTGWCAAINARYYAYFGPFFDSLSFDNQLADVHGRAVQNGIADAIASTSGSTVALPWFPAAMLARVTPLSRSFGTYFQGVLFFAFLTSLAAYLHICGAYDRFTILVALALVTNFRCLYRIDGGIPDFRMDLGFFLLFGCSICMLFISEARESFATWLCCGMVWGMTCLERATAPIYLGVTVAPLLIAYILRADTAANARSRAFSACIAVAACFALSGWMYWSRWNQLKWYYCVWNRHANVHGPFLPTLAWHLRQVFADIGPLGIVMLLTLMLFGRGGICRSVDGRRQTLQSVRWGLFYSAVAPVLLLAFQGAGHNPFVSMPAIAGLTLFCLNPGTSFGSARPHFRVYRLSNGALLCIALSFSAFSAADGWVNSPRGQVGTNTMSGQLAVVDRLAQYCPADRTAVFSCAAFGQVNNASIINVLLFDRGFSSTPFGVERARVHLAADPHFQPTEPVEWKSLPGRTDAEKMDALADAASDKLDFLVLGDPLTRAALQSRGFRCEINRFADEIDARLLSRGMWTPAGRPIVISANEVLQVYQNGKHMNGPSRAAARG